VFGFLAILLTFVLVTFGGVLRHTWLAVEIGWLLASGLLLTVRFVRRRSVDASLAAFVAVAGLIALLAQAKLGVGLMAAAWSYLAARNGETRIRRFFLFLVWVVVLEAVLGLVQYFVSPGWILGYQNIFYKASGTLINRNHFAGLLEMLIPVTMGLAYSSARRFESLARPYLLLLSGAFMGLALIFSESRMGIFSFFATTAFVATLLRFTKSQRRTSFALGFGIVGLVLAGALWVGIDGIIQRYSVLAGDEATLSELRFFAFQDELRMIAANPRGVGTGMFQDRFRQYQKFHLEWLFDHAHNDYLEAAAEWGLPVAAAFWSFLIFVVIRGVRLFASVDSPGQRGILLACSGAIFSILLHSLTDFNLHIPSNAMLFFTFVGISLALPLRNEAEKYAETTN
jgi:O-antigen ligase